MGQRHGAGAILLLALLFGLFASCSHSWQVKCSSGPLSGSIGRTVSVMRAVLKQQRIPGFVFGRRDADGVLTITVYKRGRNVNVKFRLVTESVFVPTTRYINFGPVGYDGPPLLSIPGRGRMRWRFDGPKYWITGWVMNAQRKASLNASRTVADVLQEVDTDPGSHYAVVNSAANWKGAIRGQLRRAFFVPCVAGRGRRFLLEDP
ncbi:hypothetical protein CLOM_g11851 [Closterium sp. NIES-68]|nr:hypothetical protein CLOM_g11851 [Closterium sp. NIES-68]GJP67871.1 hypothetical protein CLOP_g24634 [Closterium sp. NIES-67]